MLMSMNVPMEGSLKIKKYATEAQNSDYSDRRKIRSGKYWSVMEEINALSQYCLEEWDRKV